jgi:hypothetical protein
MPATVRVKVSRAALRSVGRRATGAKVASTTRKVFNRARVLSPWDTGLLRASHTISLTEDRSRNRVTGRVSVRTHYALAVHDGTDPYAIRPNRKQALRFRYRGRVVIVKSVRHPGIQGRPWLATALREIAGRDGFAVHRDRPGGSDDR